LLVGDNDAVEPVECADDEDEHVTCDPEVGAYSHHEETKQDLYCKYTGA
jgi:hypothetical protein